MKRSRAVLFLAALLAAGCAVRSTDERIVRLGTPIRHDDFTFTVTHVARKFIAAAQIAYDVQISVANEAKRVNYNWRDEIAYVRDARGVQYKPASDNAIDISPGDVARLNLRFVLPADAAVPKLRFWDGIFMGDALNGVAYARAAVPLR